MPEGNYAKQDHDQSEPDIGKSVVSHAHILPINPLILALRVLTANQRVVGQFELGNGPVRGFTKSSPVK